MNNKFIIPDQLRSQRFIETYQKRPTKANWTLDSSLYSFNEKTKEWINVLDGSVYIDSQTNNPYNSKNINNYSINTFQTNNTTYGVLCGFNGLFVIDVDSKELDDYLNTILIFQKTFAVRTANSRLTHFYFISEKDKHPRTIRVNDVVTKKRLCDIQGVGAQVVGPGSMIKVNEEEKFYEVINQEQIKVVDMDKIINEIKKFYKNNNIKISLNECGKKENISGTDVETYIEKDPICKEIKDKIKIKDLLELWGIDTSRNPCETPFTRDSHGRGSLSFTEDVFHDFNTGKTGNVIQMYMEYNNIDFVDAKNQLSLIANITLDENLDIFSSLFKFYYLTNSPTQKFGIINLGNKSIKQMKKNEVVDFIVYSHPDIYNKLGINISNTSKKRVLLTEKINKYIETPGNIEIISGFGYRPINDVMFTFEGEKYLNEYKTPKIHNLNIIEDINPSEFPNVAAIIQHLCKKDQEIYDYFLDWLSFQLKYPMKKLPTSFIFMGAHGTGKGILKLFILDYIFGHDNVTEVTQNTIIRGWGDYIRKSRIIFADEINLHSKQYDDVCDRLKNNTTNPFITVDIKRMNSEKIQNFTHWIFTSNKDTPFQIEEGDRRYNVVEQLKKIDTTYIDNIDLIINQKQHEKEILAFYSHLMNRTPRFDKLAKPMHTQEKQDLIDCSLSNTKKFINEIRTYNNFYEFCYELQQKPHIVDSCLTSSDFYSIFIKWCNMNNVIPANKNNFSKELKKSYDVVSKQKRMLDRLPLVYDLNDILGRETSPDDVKITKSTDSSAELSKDLKEFEL